MLTTPLSSFEAWVSYMSQCGLPVMARTIHEIDSLRNNEDNITGRDIARVLLHDPMMTLQVIRYLQDHRRKSQVTDVTTVEHAIMMFGTRAFFEAFTELTSIESHLADEPAALAGVMRVLSRAFHAALYVHEWAVLRHDTDVEELTSAALLHDIAEILLWITAPKLALEIHFRLRGNPLLRSAVAQTDVLGFPLLQLQLALAKAWHLPPLLMELMDDRHASHPRVRTVVLAVDLARHSANGWYDAALPDDFIGIADLLHINLDEARQIVLRTTLQAAHAKGWYRYPPAATWLPLEPTRAG
ncbi:HD-like signal output (HDOD) protein [Chitinivorax tropicus]|uniref:HD-like signal output (HDOD) protein n=1 Tax=Chitinivorax tropicus TaxID=714531 RepID=A0A840MPY3_9PROT|nr:HDOD domain-containing protein [Chitinivorax tropicus]MBB5019107.1 HD-like signal output (HDOD) protein [Chitinivorax tropicus]